VSLNGRDIQSKNKISDF